MAGSSDVAAASAAVDFSGAESFRDWARQCYPVVKPDYEELMLVTPLRMKATHEKLLWKQDKKKQKPTEEKEAYESPQVAMLVRTVQSLTNELAAMKVSTSGGGRNNNSNRNRNRHDNCAHCGKPNHNEAECWTKFPAKYQEFLQKKNSKA